jgi:hypothetical protein
MAYTGMTQRMKARLSRKRTSSRRPGTIITQAQIDRASGPISAFGAILAMIISAFGSVLTFNGGWGVFYEDPRALLSIYTVAALGLEGWMTYQQWKHGADWRDPEYLGTLVINCYTTFQGYYGLVVQFLQSVVGKVSQLPEEWAYWPALVIYGFLVFYVARRPEKVLVDRGVGNVRP